MPALRAAGKAWLLAFSLVQCMLITTLYQSLFRASTILRQKQAPFASYEQVVGEVETGRYRITEDAHGDWFTNEIEHSGEAFYERLRNAVARYPVVQTGSANESLECVRAGRYTKFFQDDAQTYYMARTSDCDISFVYDGFPSMEARLPFLKGSPLTELFNDAIERELVEISRIQRKYYETLYGRIQKNNCRAMEFRNKNASEIARRRTEGRLHFWLARRALVRRNPLWRHVASELMVFTLAGGSFFVHFWLVLASTLGRDRIIFLFLVLNGIALLAEFTALVAFVVHLMHSDTSTSLEVLSTTESAVIHIMFVFVNLVFNTVVEYIEYGLYKFHSRGTKSTVSVMLNRYSASSEIHEKTESRIYSEIHIYSLLFRLADGLH